MEVREGNLIFVKDDSFNEYQKIAGGRIPSKAQRPFCVVLSDPKYPDIFWAIPLTSQVDKFQLRAQKSPDKFKFYKLSGKNNCFNISSAIPILLSDVKNVYTKQGKPIGMDSRDFSDLKKHFNKIIKTPDKWEVVISQVNVKELYAHVAQKIELRKSPFLDVEVKEQKPFSPKTEVLPEAQRELWPMLKDVPSNFVLYGGTAVALRYGHRESVDFDFFSSENKGLGNLYSVVSKLPFIKRYEAQKPGMQKDRDGCQINYLLTMSNGKAVQISFVDSKNAIPGSVNAPDVAPDNGIRIASSEDLMATKVHTLGKRRSVKDLIDIATMIKSGVSLDKGFEIAMRFRQDTLSKDFDVFRRISISLQNPATVESFFKNDKDAPEDLKKFSSEVKQIIPAAAAKLKLEELVNTPLRLNKDLSHGRGPEKCQGMEL